MSKSLEFITDDLAIVGDIVINMATPDPSVPLDAPRVREVDSLPYSIWGLDNLFPQNVIAKVEADTELGALLDWKSRLLQGEQVIAVEEIWNEAKKDFDIVRVNDQRILDFLNDIPFQRYWREACTDFTWFQNIFPDLIKSKDGKTIASINCHQAAWTRVGKMDKTGTIRNAFVAVDWRFAIPGDEYTKEHVVVDPYDSAVVEKTQKNKSLKRFIYPVGNPSPGKAYYALAPWVAFINSDWYSIKTLIPQWKLKFMQRILSASKVLVIPATYWPLVNKDWASLDKDKQREIKKAKVKEISESLTGIDGVGATVLSETGIDAQGNPIPALEIKSIETGFTEGQHLEDSQEASQHLMRSLNVDPTIVGHGPGRGNDAGSGSDKRIAMNIATAILTPYRNVILEPLVFKAKYDGWFDDYPNLRFRVVEVDLGTLDQGPTSQRSNPVTPQIPAN